jgi:pyruvate,water dikinase
LFKSFYNRFVRRQEDPPALAFLLGFDSTPMLAEKSLYDLARWCQDHPPAETSLISCYQLGAMNEQILLV